MITKIGNGVLDGAALRCVRIPITNHEGKSPVVVTVAQGGAGTKYLMALLYDDRGTVSLAGHDGVIIGYSGEGESDAVKTVDCYRDAEKENLIIIPLGDIAENAGVFRCNLRVTSKDADNVVREALTGQEFFVVSESAVTSTLRTKVFAKISEEGFEAGRRGNRALDKKGAAWYDE